MDYGLKVSRPGYDVLTASDVQLAFSSKFNYFKIVTTGVVSLSVDSGAGFFTQNIAHGLSFVPVAFCYILATGGTAPNKTYFVGQRISDGFGFSPLMFFTIDSTNLIINIKRPNSGTTTWNLRYYIFYNRIE